MEKYIINKLCYQDAALKDEDHPARVQFCQDVLDDMQVEVGEDSQDGQGVEDMEDGQDGQDMEDGEDTLTAEEVWCFCNLYLQFIPHIILFEN